MKDKARLLIVDDSVESLELIDTQLDNKYHTSLVTSLSEARKKLLNNRYHIAIVDLVLPGENGLDLIRELTTDHPYTAVIAISGQASIEAAVMAMKLGAAEFLVKPLSNPDLINIMVEKTLQAQWSMIGRKKK